MVRSREKKLNKRIIAVLIAGSNIETENMSPKGKSFFEQLKRFFKRGLDQMSKDFSSKVKNPKPNQ